MFKAENALNGFLKRNLGDDFGTRTQHAYLQMNHGWACTALLLNSAWTGRGVSDIAVG